MYPEVLGSILGALHAIVTEVELTTQARIVNIKTPSPRSGERGRQSAPPGPPYTP